MSNTADSKTAITTPTNYHFMGGLPNFADIYGRHPQTHDPEVCLLRIRKFLTAHPARFAQFLTVKAQLPNGEQSVRYLIGYRAQHVRALDGWVPAVYEVSQTADLFGDVTRGWLDAKGDVGNENRFLFTLLLEETGRRPEAHATLRSMVLTDLTGIPGERVNAANFWPLPEPVSKAA